LTLEEWNEACARLCAFIVLFVVAAKVGWIAGFCCYAVFRLAARQFEK
jgi:hypothetical protein